MRLKSIKIAGFKSFADPVTIHVQHALSGIVGPNGAGKSNVIDAMRWVTGESSAKSLRGGTLDDVIFSGSSSRKTASRASVELLFDNSLGRCPGQWANYAEISVRRSVTREGASEFYINNIHCRRTDVKDVFLGTGFGSRSYSIIEQGMISRIVDSRPEGLSEFIEEASGVSKFRARRHETNLRLNRTQENLDRLSDMRTEVEHRLRQLKRQADQARRYRNLKEKFHALRAQMLSVDWQQLMEQIKSIEKRILSLETEKARNSSLVSKYDSELEQARHQQIEQRNRVHELQMEHYRVNAEISNLERRIKENDEILRQQQQSLSEKSEQVHEIEIQVDDLETKQSACTDHLKRTDELLQQALNELDEKRQTLSLSENQLNELQSSAEQIKQKLTNAIGRRESTVAVREEVAKKLSENEQRIVELKLEAKQIESTLDSAETDPLQLQFDELMRESEKLRLKLENADTSLSEKRARGDRFAEELEELLDQTHEVQVKLNTLEQSANASEGAEIAKQWLKEHMQLDSLEVSEKVVVREGWERAVDGVLGDRLSALLVDDVGRLALRVDEQTFPIRVYFVDNTGVDEQFSERVDALAKFVDSEDHVITNMLSGVYVASSIEDALDKKEGLNDDECMVTAEGAMIGPNWFSPAVSSESGAGVLETANLINRYRKQVEYLGSQEHEKREQIADNRQDVLRIELEISKFRNQSSQAALRLEDTRRQLHEIDSNRVRSMERLNQLKIQLQQRSDEQIQINLQLEELIKQISSASQLSDQTGLEYSQQAGELDKQTALVKQHRLSVTDAINTKHQYELELQKHNSDKDLYSASLSELQLRHHKLCIERDDLSKKLSVSDDPIAILRKELEDYVVESRHWESKLSVARDATTESEDSYRSLDEKRVQHQLEVEKVNSQIHEHQIEMSKLSVLCEEIQQKLTELNTSPKEEISKLDEEFNYETSVSKLERFRRRIEKEGAVNLIAVEQFEEETKRKQYMDDQHADLTRAVEILRDTITKIDRESREQYIETFSMVNSEFQRLVPLLFGGGSGNLELTGDYPQDAGLRIFVRPKGKRIHHIQSLSGGEKALTAVALLLSFFHLNPSPVCLLDEIDAPLDDENVYRLCESLRGLSDTTQVILITHNKITMEAVDSLIGVTMPEPNVSRVLSVDLQDAQEYAA